MIMSEKNAMRKPFKMVITFVKFSCCRYINIDDCWLAHERDRYLTRCFLMSYIL